MKLTDFLIDSISKQGVKHIFGLTGGAAVHIFESAAKNKQLTPVFCHHEQAAALASVAYAKVNGTIGVTVVTTGPGCTNALTGLLAAWQDSIPCVFISGQARINQTSRGKNFRQRGLQEMDIISVVAPITKYAVMIERVEEFRFHLEKAIFLAKEGRPGPVWIDLPLNFQWAEIEPQKLAGFDPPNVSSAHPAFEQEAISAAKTVFQLLSECERPLIFAGYGIRLAHAQEEFVRTLQKLAIPFVSTWTAADLFNNRSQLYLGRIGPNGQRGGNLAVQNCDLLISIGSHLGVGHTGGLTESFAKNAKKVVIDVDQHELDNSIIKIDHPIRCDAKRFLEQILNTTDLPLSRDFSEWQAQCARYRGYNQMPADGRNHSDFVDPYLFMDKLSSHTQPGDIIVVDGGGTNLYISFQALKLKTHQRMIVSGNISAMGTGLPESIGACFANGRNRTICTIGDGSLQLNLQELQTIAHHNLPIKIFVMNNDGYLAIRHTQQTFFDKRYVGSCVEGGVSLPDTLKVAAAYSIKAERVQKNADLDEAIQRALAEPGPFICEFMVSPDQELLPRIGWDKMPDGTYKTRPLEDMYPYLDRQELKKNMVEQK